MLSNDTVAELLASFRQNPIAFNEIALCRPAYWSRQKDICNSFLNHRITVVATGNSVGKSFVAAGLVLYSLLCFPGSRNLSTAPSNQLLSDVLWSEVRQAWNSSIFKDLFGTEIKANPQRLQLADGWNAVGWSSDSTAKMSGRHKGDLTWVIDEASDIAPEIWEGIWSTNPSKVLVLGNPLKIGTEFHKLATQPNPQVNVLHISSLESPHINLERSPVGMADATWVDGVRYQYGEHSPYWNVHVAGRFCDEDTFVLISQSWLDLCTTPPDPSDDHGPRWISVDLSAGTGRGDLAVILVRDNDQIWHMSWSNSWLYPQGVAEKVKEIAALYHVDAEHVTFDAGGLGAGFHYALDQHGLGGAYGYVGAEAGGKYATNFRGASALALRDRLDPSKNAKRFYIPPNYLAVLRREIAELRYELSGKEAIKLENKEKMRSRLGSSPDALDALIMSFCR